MEGLAVFTTIKGIGSASGLHLKGDTLYVIGDNSGYLYAHNILTSKVSTYQILPEQTLLVNIPKAEKPDFEAIGEFGNSLYLFGSGSTSKRNLLVIFNLDTKEVVHHDLTVLYQRISTETNIDEDNFNVEGVVFNGHDWLLFNRGNGALAKNGIIRLGGNELQHPASIEYIPFSLKNNEQIAATFTDAVLLDEEIYFIAAAEDTTSTYQDGEILGSYLGCLNLTNLQLKHIKKISTTQKFEGITVFKNKLSQNEFLICEDTDTEILETIIYRMKL